MCIPDAASNDRASYDKASSGIDSVDTENAMVFMDNAASGAAHATAPARLILDGGAVFDHGACTEHGPPLPPPVPSAAGGADDRVLVQDDDDVWITMQHESNSELETGFYDGEPTTIRIHPRIRALRAVSICSLSVHLPGNFRCRLSPVGSRRDGC